MLLYRLCLALHFLAALVWLGHMFFWSLFSGPALKKVRPAETAELLRESSLRMGGLGWPALLLLVATGAYMLAARGLLAPSLSGDLLALPGGRPLAAKLLLVAAMVGYQIRFGHRRAPRAIYLNMLAALLVIGASVLLARGL